MIATLLTSLLIASTPADRVTGFAAATAQAKEQDKPLVVYVHGSDWNELGQRLFDDMWNDASTDRMLHDFDVILVDIDVLQTATEQQRDAFNQLHQGWKKQGLVTYPALIALGPDGAVLGSRQGEFLPRNSSEARAALHELVQASIQSVKLRARINQARAEDNTASEISAIHAVIDLPLDRPTDLLSRLTEIDPEDATGLRRRLTLPPWHQLISEATRDAKEGRASEALGRLNTLLEDEVYSDSQRAWLHVATGAVYRKMDNQQANAAKAFQEAWRLDPEGIAGNAGKRWYLRFHNQPTLLFGWQPRHCADKTTTWTLEDLPEDLQAGSWQLTLQWTKGRHGLAVDRVEIIDSETGAIIATDVHEGFTGTKNSENTYVLQVDQDLKRPQLRVTGRSSGGTDSHGTIELTRRD